MSAKKIFMVVTIVITVISMLAACGTPTQAPATQAPVTTEAVEKFTIGISNPFISSEYRTQMIAELQEVNQEYMDQGITNELVIESADTDVAGQIQQLQNLMAKNVDAILVNPGDVNGLNATLQEAVDKGILVISVDQELNVPGVYNVGIDQKAWAKTSAQWLADKLGGTGNIVEIEGFPGHPANVARMEGVDEVFARYPGITVLAKDTGRWDEATGQQVMSNFLSAYPDLTGYWTQDGMAIGALQAIMAANPATWPQGVGEGRCQFLRLWQEALTMKPDFDSIAVANHPGVSPTGLRIAVNILQGKEVDTNKLGGVNGLSFVLPLAAVITKDNLADGIAMCEGKPDAYLLDKIMTEEEVQQYFVKTAGTTEMFTVGISNPFISSEYRTQMIAELQEVNQEYMDQGIANELVIESADTDVAGQIQQLQNLMAQNVDAILVNPGDVNGLNATLIEALNKGIIVISVDQELNVPGVYNVGIDQKAWAMTSAQWLADKLGGTGNIVEIEGFPGHPANVARMTVWTKSLPIIPTSRYLPRTPAGGMKPPASRSCPTSWQPTRT